MTDTLISDNEEQLNAPCFYADLSKNESSSEENTDAASRQHRKQSVATTDYEEPQMESSNSRGNRRREVNFHVNQGYSNSNLLAGANNDDMSYSHSTKGNTDEISRQRKKWSVPTNDEEPQMVSSNSRRNKLKVVTSNDSAKNSANKGSRPQRKQLVSRLEQSSEELKTRINNLDSSFTVFDGLDSNSPLNKTAGSDNEESNK